MTCGRMLLRHVAQIDMWPNSIVTHVTTIHPLPSSLISIFPKEMNFHTLSVSITPSSSSSSLVPCTPKTYLCSNINNESSRVNSPAPSQLTTKRRCLFCGRRHFVEAATLATTLFPIKPSRATNNSDSDYDYADVLNQFHPPKPDWYEEFYAWVMNSATKSYEAEVAKYKSQVLSNLKGKALKILEVGIGTGPNLSYYANDSDVHVVGIDPNPKMEKYARSSARLAGLLLSNFEFFQAVGEAIPLSDASVDAVVGTLVLCSVKDVDLALKERRLQVTAKKKKETRKVEETLRRVIPQRQFAFCAEVKRVLRPGGKYVFVEHVAAKDGTTLKIFQRLIDPLQQILADGCHLSRDTGNSIYKAGFSSVEFKTAFVSNASFINPHIYGIAYK
ncbi:hypothetical protein Ahy_B05g077234 isoform A [Arachis hypogaea]|uniref:Methyltransferase type 11 domain-containing protein n=1 Tax=Arachis hypogaea TaxID=3818 RepID=A0A444Z4K0_ARAHY|nr:hypothetical protein Ahy_B05g077234 isoform A [Arachis hypogaea]